jgi:hypothetical protein
MSNDVAALNTQGHVASAYADDLKTPRVAVDI